MLTNLQWVLMLSIKCQPNYRFIGIEKAAAQRMVTNGLLRWNPRQDSIGQCYITAKGERAYQEFKSTHFIISAQLDAV